MYHKQLLSFFSAKKYMETRLNVMKFFQKLFIVSMKGLNIMFIINIINNIK